MQSGQPCARNGADSKKHTTDSVSLRMGAPFLPGHPCRVSNTITLKSCLLQYHTSWARLPHCYASPTPTHPIPSKLDTRQPHTQLSNTTQKDNIRPITGRRAPNTSSPAVCLCKTPHYHFRRGLGFCSRPLKPHKSTCTCESPRAVCMRRPLALQHVPAPSVRAPPKPNRDPPISSVKIGLAKHAVTAMVGYPSLDKE